MLKKILLIVGTHGNERIGLEVITRLRLLGLDIYFDCLLANPLATIQNKRYIQNDLNRSYPGDINSNIYEKRLAAYNLQIAKKYQYVIDIHEASFGTDNFVIIPKKQVPKKFPLSWIALRHLLLWPDPAGPLSQILPRAIELEFGMKNKNREMIVKRATEIVRTFIDYARGKQKMANPNKKNVYYVYGKLLKSDYKENTTTWRDFRTVVVKGEIFLPLLVGQYLNKGIICYKMRKIKITG